MKTCMALIVGRGGSKSIPSKNIKMMNGKPLIAYTIEAATQSKCFDRIILSTDDGAIADIGKQYGADVPIMRPHELAGDTSPIIDASLHMLNWLENNQSYIPDYVMLLQPTSPMRTSEDLHHALQQMIENEADAVVSVVPVDQHPALMKTIDIHNFLIPFIPGNHESRRQDLPPVYTLNGAIYCVKRSVLLKSKSWCPPGALAYVMPRERSIDIDTPVDWALAELLMQNSA